MANQEHLDILKQGVEVWNQWRQMHPDIKPELNEATLAKVNLSGNTVDYTIVDWIGYTSKRSEFLSKLYTQSINLSQVNLRGTDLSDSNLSGANLSGADLSYANLYGANLTSVNLTSANLEQADLGRANLIEANLDGANLTGCHVYGISAWDMKLNNTTQSDLIITRYGEASITVDNLEVAQFIYLLLNNEKIRDVINTIGQKGVLILGRFNKERKPVLDALRKKLRTLNFLPIVFDFERPTERDFTETIMTLAGLSCFIIADITNPRSSPLELQATIPNYMIPFVPIIQEGEHPFSMFRDLQGKYNWVLDTLIYDTPSNLIKGLESAVVKPALEKRIELLATKIEQLRTRHIGDYL